jgi:uncharacterized protein (DUF1330 family)
MLKSALLLGAGIAIGAGGITAIHAQTKTHYQIAIIDIKDEAGYKAAVGDVRKNVESMGGKFIVTAGAGGGNAMGGITSPTNSKLPSRIVISEWSGEPKLTADGVKSLEAHATLAIYNVEGLK